MAFKGGGQARELAKSQPRDTDGGRLIGLCRPPDVRGDRSCDSFIPKIKPQVQILPGSHFSIHDKKVAGQSKAACLNCAGPFNLSRMLRPLIALLSCAALAAPGAAFAQDKPLSIYFTPCEDQRLNDAITAVLSQPPFVLAIRPTLGALIVSMPDKVLVQRGRVSGITWTFNVAFSRDGSPLGQSVQSCNESKISDCTDQLVSDIKSAAGVAP